MADNLNIKGIESDESGGTRRLKPRGKRRKKFTIEYRLNYQTSLYIRHFRDLREWSVHSRYLTPSRRDQALAALVKKNSSFFEYRKGGGAP